MPRRRVVVDHVTVGVSDLARSREFYARALLPLGFSEIGYVAELDEVEFGLEEAADFAISNRYGTGSAVHVAFAADRREQVDAFYAAALDAGGRDNGQPGLRPEYSADYQGAFVLDPDGHNIEAVHHGRAQTQELQIICWTLRSTGLDELATLRAVRSFQPATWADTPEAGTNWPRGAYWAVGLIDNEKDYVRLCNVE